MILTATITCPAPRTQGTEALPTAACQVLSGSDNDHFVKQPQNITS